MARAKGSWCGEANPRYNGGRYKTAAGYVFVRAPDHPNADKRGYVREHVLVASATIGRPIAKGEVVHHINGIKDDNRPENLEVMERGKHHSLHHRGVMKPASLANLRPMTSEWQKAIWDSGAKDHMRTNPRTCDLCGKQFIGKRLFGRANHAHVFCGRKCYALFRSKEITDAKDQPQLHQ